MSKAVAALVIGGVAVGVVVLIASTSKASAATPKPLADRQFGNAQTVSGRSGYVWAIAPLMNPGPVAPGVNVQGVFLAQRAQGASGTAKPGELLLLFAQQGDDMNTRTLVSTISNSAADVAAAKLDMLGA
jgi:hypothetical protein